MELTVLGSSPALPNSNNASSGYLVREGRTALLLDCGHGVVGALRSCIDVADITAILISHMHPDHYFDLIPLSYAYFFGNLPPIPLYLPPEGSAALARVAEAAGLENGIVDGLFEIHEYNPTKSLRIGEISARFAPGKHFVPVYAVRLEGRIGGSLAYSSDTSYTRDVVDLARGATIGMFESAVLEYRRDAERLGHLDAATAGRMAREASVESLLITHYPTSEAEDIQRVAAEAFGAAVAMAHPGLKVTT